MRWGWTRTAATLMVLLCAGVGLAAAQPVADSTLNWAFGGTVHAVARAGNVVYVGGEFQGVARRRNATGGFAALAPDTSRRAVRTPRVHGTVNAVVSDGASGWFVGGNFTWVGAVWRPQIAHIRGDGTLDLSWTGRVNGRVYALARVGSTLYVGGDFSSAGSGVGPTLPAPRRHLAAFAVADGALQPALATGADAAVSVLAAQSATLYVGGDFTSLEGQPRLRLGAIDTTTLTVLSWDPQPDGPVLAIAARPGGASVFVGGGFAAVGGETRAHLAELDAVTGRATAWNPGADGRVHALAPAGDMLYVGGAFTTLAGAARNHAGAVSAADGTVAPWDPNADDSVHALGVTDTLVYLGGRFEHVGGRIRLHAAAVDRTTGAPSAFHPALNDPVRTLVVGADTVALGGTFEAIGGYARRNLAAINLETGALLPWNPRTDGPVRALAVAGGTLYVGGAFTGIAQQPRARLAALDVATGALASWNPGADQVVLTLAAATSAGTTTIYVGGDFTLLGGQPRTRLGAVDALSAAAVAGFAPGVADAPVLALSVDTTHLYVGGQFTTLGGHPLSHLARVDRGTGAADAAWAPQPNGPVRAVARGGALVYAGGAFTAIAGVARAHVAALTLTAPAAATDWQPNPDRAVNAVAPRGAVVFLGGEFARVRGTLRPRLAGVAAAAAGGGPYLLPWRPRWYGEVRALHASDDGVVAAGEALPDLDDQEPDPVGRAAFYPQAGLGGPPAPPVDAGVELHRRGLTVSWGPPVRGSRPLRYLLEAGTGPALRNLVSGADLGDATEATFAQVPPGTYYLRLRSVGPGGVSTATPDVAVTVGAAGCGAPPEAPGGLAATVTSGIVTLDWEASPSPVVLGYRLEAGSAPGQTLVRVPAGPHTTTFSAPVPAGRYIVRVVALSACGESAPTNEVIVDVGGGTQPPAAPTDLEATVTDNGVQITWKAAAHGSPAGGYVLQAGTGPGLADLGRVPVAGTAVRVPGVPAGTYYLRVVGVNAAGPGAASDELVLVVP